MNFILKNALLMPPAAKIDQPLLAQEKKYTVTETFGDYIPLSSKRITFGLLRPGSQSTNLGDYMQTLAQVNILSHFYNPSTWQCSPIIHMIFQEFAKSKPIGFGVRQQQHPCKVRIVWFNRDNSATELVNERSAVTVEGIRVALI